MARKSSKRKNKDRSEMKERARRKVRERAKKSAEGSGINWLSLPKDFDGKDGFFEHKKGVNKISILPYEVTVDDHPAELEPGDLWYEKTVYVHYGIGASNKAIVCPKTFNKKCPICEYASGLWNDGEEDEARNLFSSKRQVFNVLVDGEVKLWTLSHYCFGKLLEDEILYDEDKEFDGFYFLEKEEGYDLKVRFVEESIGKNKYLEVGKIDFVPRRKDLSEELYDEVIDLDEIVECPTYKEVKEAFFEEEEEEEEKPKRQKKKTSKRKRNETEQNEEEENEEEENEEEEEEEEEKPKRQKKKTSKRKKSKSEDECPNGLVFGDDCDSDDACDDCEVWDVCLEEQENNKRKTKR